MAMTCSGLQDLVFKEVNYTAGQFKRNFASRKVNASEEHVKGATTAENAASTQVAQTHLCVQGVEDLA